MLIPIGTCQGCKSKPVEYKLLDYDNEVLGLYCSVCAGAREQQLVLKTSEEVLIQKTLESEQITKENELIPGDYKEQLEDLINNAKETEEEFPL